MPPQRFIRQLIEAATEQWEVLPADFTQSVRATPARIAVFHVAYTNGLTRRDVMTAFGWNRKPEHYWRERQIEQRHERLCATADYARRHAALANLASAIAGDG